MPETPPQSDSPSTVFDSVYRTIVQNLPMLVLPLINEMFGTDYALDTPSEQLRNEHLTAKDDTIITDSIFRIGEKLYHIECQSTPDGRMAIRMVEYGLLIALSHAERDPEARNHYTLRFPQAGAIYLRHTSKTPDELRVDILLPDGQSAVYRAPILKAQTYSLEDIFQKKLLLLLPYYLMRYEKELDAIEQGGEAAAEFRARLRQIVTRLQEELQPLDRADIYVDLIHLMQEISHHILRNHKKIRKEVDAIMGGTIMKLYSEEIAERSEARGEARGRAEGEARGRAEGARHATLRFVRNLLAMRLPYEDIAKSAETTVEEVHRIAKESGLAY